LLERCARIGAARSIPDDIFARLPDAGLGVGIDTGCDVPILFHCANLIISLRAPYKFS
jgi:hypothetical protein